MKNDYSVVDNIGSKIYLLTNWKAPKQRLMVFDAAYPDKENWKEVIPETANVLENVALIGGKIVATYMKDASNHAYLL